MSRGVRAEAMRLVVDAERSGAQLVGSAQVDAIDLAILWDGVEVNDTGQHDEGEPRIGK